MLCAVGDLVEDVVVLLSGPPNAGSDVDARISRHRGGSAANVAAAAAAAGGAARFVGQVGDDDLGDRLLHHLAAAGVDPVAPRGGRTGTIVALVAPDGERTMLSDRGAAPDLAACDPAWLDGVTVLHLPAYSLVVEPLASTAGRLAGMARARGIPMSVGASSVAVLRGFGPDRFARLLADLAPDVLLANRDEARLLGLDGVTAAPAGVVVVTRGADPTVVLAGDGRDEVAVPPVEVIDTTGAGDAFAAGFLTAWAAGSAPVEAVRRGHRLAREVVDRPGAELPR